MKPTVFCLFTFGCFVSTLSVDVAAAQRLKNPRDTSLVAAIARSIADSVDAPLRIDPDPLPRSLDVVVDATAADWRSRGDSALEAGLGSIARIGKRLAGPDAQDRCGSGMAPYRPESLHKGCPKSPKAQYIAVIGTPRPGGAARPRRTALQQSMDQKQGLWSVRVLLTLLTPYGSGTTVFDYVAVRDATGWKVTKRVGLLEVE